MCEGAGRKSWQGATLILFSISSLTDIRCALVSFLIVEAMFRWVFSVGTESLLTDFMQEVPAPSGSFLWDPSPVGLCQSVLRRVFNAPITP